MIAKNKKMNFFFSIEILFRASVIIFDGSPLGCFWFQSPSSVHSTFNPHIAMLFRKKQGHFFFR